MKVLKHGKFFELGPTKCLHCDCLFTFSKHEVVSSFNREEGYDELYYVRIDQDSFVIEPWKMEEEEGGDSGEV